MTFWLLIPCFNITIIKPEDTNTSENFATNIVIFSKVFQSKGNIIITINIIGSNDINKIVPIIVKNNPNSMQLFFLIFILLRAKMSYNVRF